jgi:hypothetical protein
MHALAPVARPERGLLAFGAEVPDLFIGHPLPPAIAVGTPDVGLAPIAAHTSSNSPAAVAAAGVRYAGNPHPCGHLI